jgi:HAD superfamily hydrolase (TIGR01509 family)
MIKACLFDLCGTLVYNAKNSAYTAERGTFAARSQSIDTLSAVGNMINVGPVDRHSRLHANAKAWLEQDSTRAPDTILPGALDFVVELYRHGVKLASTATDCKADSVLSRVGLYSLFDYVVDPERSAKMPGYEILMEVSEYLGVSPRACVAFESTPEGIEAARVVGMRSVAVGDLTKLYRADMGVPSFKGMTLQRLEEGIEVSKYEC